MKKCPERILPAALHGDRRSDDEKTPEDVLKESLDVPPQGRYLGFGIQRKGRDEFLSAFEFSRGRPVCAWVPTPETALFLRSWVDALRVSGHCSETVVVLLFDVGEEILVYPAR